MAIPICSTTFMTVMKIIFASMCIFFGNLKRFGIANDARKKNFSEVMLKLLSFKNKQNPRFSNIHSTQLILAKV
jgi:hypothetical protein